MKLFQRFKKPDWEHKDAAIRLRAVQSSREPALLDKLVELVQTDSSPDVRAAALRRIDDPVLIERRLRGENDVSVVDAARRRLIDVLCGKNVAQESGSAALLQTFDAEVLTEVAERCPLPGLRRIALERAERPALLVQRCIHDPDPGLRLWLLERINDADALQKIADGSRKRDKRLTRAARDKLQSLQFASGDASALQQLALAVGERAERLGRELPATRQDDINALQAQWSDLRARVSEDTVRRVEGALSMADAALRAAAGEPVVRLHAPAETVIETVALDVVPKQEPPPADPALEALAGQLPDANADDLDVQLARIEQEAGTFSANGNVTVEAQLSALQAAIKSLRQRRKQAEAAARDAQSAAQMRALEAALQEGHIGNARAARSALGRKVGRELQARLHAADEALAKFEEWQRWSGSKARVRLCDQAEALYGSGIHPDALANKVKELRAEWTRLDGIDGAAAPGPEHGISRRFNGLCQRALAPARPYFEKRRELRHERSGQIDALLTETITPTTDLIALRKRLRDAFNELADGAPEKRTEHGRLLRERLAEIDRVLNEQREQAALGKQGLITRLRRELGTADAPTAIDLAKRAQADWKRLPRAEREVEDRLWADLRALIDPIFNRQRDADVAAAVRSAEAEASAQSVLTELEALAAADGERLLHASAHLEALQTRWRALSAVEVSEREPDRRARDADRQPSRPSAGRGGKERPAPSRPSRSAHPHDARFEALCARVLALQATALRAREREQLEALCEAGGLLDLIERDQIERADAAETDALEATLAALTLPADAREALARRRAAAREGKKAEHDSAERLAVQAELDAGIDSPAAASSLRREAQMQRLAAKLSGQTVLPPRQAIRSGLLALHALPGLDPDQRTQWSRRMLAAWDACG